MESLLGRRVRASRCGGGGVSDVELEGLAQAGTSGVEEGGQRGKDKAATYDEDGAHGIYRFPSV